MIPITAMSAMYIAIGVLEWNFAERPGASEFRQQSGAVMLLQAIGGRCLDDDSCCLRVRAVSVAEELLG